MSPQSLTYTSAVAPRASRSLVARLAAMFRVQRERRALRTLDPALLRDIGVTPDQARREAARPLWDSPVRPF